MDIRERNKENLKAAIEYYKFREHGRGDIIELAKYKSKNGGMGDAEWLALYSEVIKEPKESKMKHLANKEPWQMTREKFFKSGKEIPGHPHIDYVREALQEGKPVPAEVLADYPDLAKPEVKPPITPPEVKPIISPELELLAQEARRYKSAEEFVKQGKYNIPQTNPDLTFSEELTGAYKGQKNLTITATKNGKVVGRLEYSEFEKIPYLNFVEVLPEYQKQNIGSDLVKELQKSYPNKKIKWGMTTPEGTRLKEALDKQLIDFYTQAVKEGKHIGFKHLD